MPSKETLKNPRSQKRVEVIQGMASPLILQKNKTRNLKYRIPANLMNPHELLKAKQKNKANEKKKDEWMRRVEETTARRAAELTARIKAAANARKKRNNETRKRIKNALSSAAEGIEAVTSTPAWMSRKLRGKFWNNNNE